MARTKFGRRKLRLVGCGSCRMFWPMFTKGRLREAILAAERYADGTITKSDAEAADHRVWWGSWMWSRADRRVATAARAVLSPTPIWMAARAGEYLLAAVLDDRRGCTTDEGLQRFAAVLRCVFANPHRPSVFDPRWRTGNAIGLAEAIATSRAFDQLPILADALEEAGCDDVDLLAHARGDGPHSLGCRVVDAALGRV